MLACQVAGGFDHFVDDLRLLCGRPQTEPAATAGPDALEPAPDVVLEHDDHEQQDALDERAKDGEDGDQLHQLRHYVEQEHGAQADGYLQRTRTASHQEDAIHHVVDEEDVDQAPQDAERGLILGVGEESLKHPSPRCCSMSCWCCPQRWPRVARRRLRR